jgi:molecular chaperone DnaJ
MDKDYYKILGVEKNASEQDIRKAFLKLSKQYHPDMQAGKTEEEKKEAESKFKEINEANEILSDKEKREYYDNFGSVNQGHGFGPGGIDPREFFRQHYRNGFGMHGFDSHFGFGDFGARRNSPPDPNAPKNGRSVEINVKVNLEDVLYGANRDLEIKVNDPCPNCKGTGSKNGELKICPDCNGTGMKTSIRGNMVMSTTCPICQGRGYVSHGDCPHCSGGTILNTRKLNITIPQGINEGCVLRVKGEGERGLNGGINGDIRIIVTTNEHEIFERHGNDLYMKMYISPISAMIGGDVDVQTPWGLAKLNIPSGTQNEKVFRLKNQGVRYGENSGDLYIVTEIEMIKNCTDEQIELLKQLEKTLTDKNQENQNNQKLVFKEFYKRNKEKITPKNG